MTEYGYALLGFAAMVALLLGVMSLGLLRFASAAKSAKRHARETGTETMLLSAALKEAVSKLEAQERATIDRIASAQLSAQIVESLTAGLLVADGSGAIEIFNPAGRRMLDVEAALPGSDYRDVLRHAPVLVSMIEECLTSSEVVTQRTIEVTVAGQPLYFGVTVSPLRDAAGLRPVAICLFSDLTKVTELEEQLRLKDTLARLGVLTAGIAHEFRNGLATIHGYGRLLDPAALPEKYRPYVEGIRQETDTLGKLVTNFLSFARPAQMDLVPVDLGAIAQRVIDDLRHDLPDGTQVTVEGQFGPVLGDELLLRQTFSNLVRNAAEASVHAGRVPLIHVVGVVDSGARTSRVSVNDNGPGVKESDRERIFEPFVTTRSWGTGLGLAIVQKVVVMHNGRISVGSSPDGGASFQLVFPLAAA